MNYLKWLYPGMNVKRWFLVLMIGVVVIGLGLAYLLREFYEFGRFPDWVYYVTLQFLPRYTRGALFLALGLGSVAFAIVRLNVSLLSALWPNGHGDSLVDAVYDYRFRRRGPKIVAIGGGTGLSTLLRGLKEYSSNITAVVTVADDGGSSGRLRRELGVLPPGDFRNCIAALAETEPLMTKLFQYRFEEGTGLEGHSFGNLFIVAMSEVTGSFERAILESSRVLAVRGGILPSTLANVTLCAHTDGGVLRGESVIGHSPQPIRRVFLEPAEAQAHPEAIRAILDADLIVIGPGSLYTSVLPNLLVEGIQRAVRSSAAAKVYVCNVATQRGETDGYGVGDHIAAIERHCGAGLFQFVVVNSNPTDIPARFQSQPVLADSLLQRKDLTPIYANVVDPEHRLRHDPRRLANAVMRIYYDRVHERQAGPVFAEGDEPIRAIP